MRSPGSPSESRPRAGSSGRSYPASSPEPGPVAADGEEDDAACDGGGEPDDVRVAAHDDDGRACGGGSAGGERRCHGEDWDPGPRPLPRLTEARPMRLRRASRRASLVRLPCPEPDSRAACTPLGAGVSHAYADRVSDQSHQTVPPCIGDARSRRASQRRSGPLRESSRGSPPLTRCAT